MSDSTTLERRRIYVGGLFPEVQPTDLLEKFARFGSVEDIQIKVRKDESGLPLKTFAYLSINGHKKDFDKCFSTFNKAKWKGSMLILQNAKENFLTRLEKERAEVDQPESPVAGDKMSSLHDPFHEAPGVQDFVMRGAVPGTPIPGEKNWVVGKYGRVLPIVHLKKSNKRKIVRVDPSKLCHNLKKIKDADDKSDKVAVDNLTWDINDQDSEITKKRKGEFPVSKKKSKSANTGAKTQMVMEFLADRNRRMAEAVKEANDFEIVQKDGTVKKNVRSMKRSVVSSVSDKNTKPSASKGDVSSASDVNSADTDEIIAATKTSGKKKSNFVHKASQSFQDRLSECTSDSDSDLDEGEAASFVYIPGKKAAAKKNLKLNSASSDSSESDDSHRSSDSDAGSSDGEAVEMKGKGAAVMGIGCVSETRTLLHQGGKKTVKCSEESATSSGVGSDTDTSSGVGSETDTSSEESSHSDISESDGSSSSDDDFQMLDENAEHTSNKAAKKSNVNKMENKFSCVKQGGRNWMLQIPEFKGRSSLDVEEDTTRNGTVKHKNTDVTDTSLESADKRKSNISSTNPASTKVDRSTRCSSSDDSDTEDSDDSNSDGSKSNDSNSDGSKSNDSNSDGSKSNDSDDSNSASSADTDEILSGFRKSKDKSVNKAKGSSSIVTQNSAGPGVLDEFSCGFLLKDDEIVYPTVSVRKNSDTDSDSSQDDFPSNEYTNANKASKEMTNNKDRRKFDKEKVRDHGTNVQGEEDTKEKRKERTNVTLKTRLSADQHKAGKEELPPLDKHADDNRRRLETLKERKKEIQTKKALVQQALAKVDSGSRLNKKIVFDSDDDMEEDTAVISATSDVKTPSLMRKTVDSETSSSSDNSDEDKEESLKEKKQLSLFDSSTSDDEEEEDDKNMFRIRPQYKGDKGKKLMELQSRFGNDVRFKIDERFVESDEEGEETKDVSTEAEGESERSRSLRILEDVVGRQPVARLLKQESQRKTFKDTSVLHFDPTREEHAQFEIQDPVKEKVPKKKNKKKSMEVEEEEVVLPEVSKERSYEVSSSFQDAFTKSQQQSSGFSLLAAFGKNEDPSMETGDTVTEVRSRPSSVMHQWEDRFSVDSSDVSSDEQDEELKQHSAEQLTANENSTVPARTSTFFFTEDDVRLKEGIDFFIRPDDFEAVVERWREQRPKLVESYKEKLRKAVKNKRKLQLQKNPVRRLGNRGSSRHRNQES